MNIMNSADIAGILKKSFVPNNPPLIVFQDWQYIVTPESLKNPTWIEELPLLAEIVVPIDEDEEDVYMLTAHGWVNFMGDC